MKTTTKTLLNPLASEVEMLRALLLKVEQEKAQISQEFSRLQESYSEVKKQLDWLLRQIFGKKSERVVSDTQEIQLELEGFSVDPESPPPLPPSEPKPRRKPVRNGKDAIKLPPDLPVKTTVIDIPEEDKFCKETGLPLVEIGKEVTHKLAHQPGSYFVLEIIRPKYANPNSEEQGIVCAELPSTIFPKCRADDSLLADIAVKKFGDHLPLYRISDILQRDGIGISRKLLSQWMGHCGVALTPLYDEMLKRALESGNIFVDESPVNIQNVGRVKKGYMWVIIGGNEANPSYRIYHFAESRAHSHIFEMLSTFKGTFHSDKYAAYETLAKKEGVIWNPCFAHIRRYFFEVESGDLEFRSWVLRKIRYLYMLERVAWNRSPEERLKIRLEKEVPIIDELIQKIKDKGCKRKAFA